jgi:Na+/proline symporter/signal transduction histidine kinase
VIAVSAAYVGLLFAVAFYADRRAASGRSVIASGTVYSLSLAVYVTSATYYGNVGRAATTGMGFLSVYVGPTLMFVLGWLVIRRIIRISRRNRITSLADFVSARYGRSAVLGGLVTVIAVIGLVPYIGLQLKAISNTFELIRRYPDIVPATQLGDIPLVQDTGLYIALALAAFAVIFGTRHLDAAERHEGMVAAIALESVVKLVVFLMAGLFVTFSVFGGFRDLFARAAARPETAALFDLGGTHGYSAWIGQILLSMVAIVLLPRQWQVAVVENVDERHLKRAIWLFPLYLLVINIFVMPIALGGLFRFSGGAGTIDADTYVLAVPMAEGRETLALLVFIGGLSASTGMVIVESVALSTMVSNSLVMPLLLRGSRLVRRRDLAGLILGIRRGTIVLVLLLGYGYFRVAGEKPGLILTALVSSAAIAQFAPSIFGGLFWKGGTRAGALVGLVAGFAVWIYTLLLPNLAAGGWLPASFVRDGPFGIALLRPQELFGLTGVDSVSHAMFWSMLVNVGGYVGVSLAVRPGAAEQAQSAAFVDPRGPGDERLGSRRASVGELRSLLERFLRQSGAERVLRAYAGGRKLDIAADADAEPDLVRHVETVLTGSVGPVTATRVIDSVVGREPLRFDRVMALVDEASQVAALEERQRLARELHDSVSQALFSMTLHLRAVELALQREGGAPDGHVARGLGELRELTHGALSEMRALIFQLRPGALHEIGLAAAIRKHAAAVAARERLEVRVHAPDERLPLDDRAEEELFRVVQEALNNSVKHAQPNRVDIRLDQPSDGTGTLVVEVADDGTGFDPHVAHPGHLGLDSMRDRTEWLGGRLTVTSSPQGSTVRAVLPGIVPPADSHRKDGRNGPG